MIQGDTLAAPLYEGCNTESREAANEIGREEPHYSEHAIVPTALTDGKSTPGGVLLDYIDDNFASARHARMACRMILAALRLGRAKGMHPAPGKMFIASYDKESTTNGPWEELLTYLAEHEKGVTPIFVHLGSSPDGVPAGMTLLGKPMGPKAYVNDYMEAKMGSKTGVRHSLDALRDTPIRRQSALLLFRYCVSERVTYFSRTLMKREYAEHARQMEEWTREFLFIMTNWKEVEGMEKFTTMARQTAELSTSRGGLGLRNATVTGAFAPIAAMADILNSRFQTDIFHMQRRLLLDEYRCNGTDWQDATTGTNGPQNETLLAERRGSYIAHHLNEAIEELHAQYRPHIDNNNVEQGTYPFPTSMDEFLEEVLTEKYQLHKGSGVFGSDLHVQRRMAHWVQDVLKQENHDHAVSKQDKIRLLSQGGTGGMAFMNMIPGNKEDKWDDSQLREVLREVTGLPSEQYIDERVPKEHQTHTMPEYCTCGSMRNPQTLTARHAAQCVRDGTRGTKHNAILRTLYETCLAHRIPCIWEPRGAYNTGIDNRGGPDLGTRCNQFSYDDWDFTLNIHRRDRCLLRPPETDVCYRRRSDRGRKGETVGAHSGVRGETRQGGEGHRARARRGLRTDTHEVLREPVAPRAHTGHGTEMAA
jgi:hypothetical protein